MSEIVIHVWPGRWELSSFDPTCLGAVLYLQLACPGHFSVSEESNPDISPSGQLPYLTHGSQVVATLPSIIAYISALNPERLASSSESETFEFIPSLDEGLSPLYQQQTVAWIAYIDSHVGDLVSQSFYASWANYSGLTRPTLVSVLDSPRRFYMPDRIRALYRPRLEMSFLWQEDVEEKPDIPSASVTQELKLPPNPKDKFKGTFGKARVLDRAKGIFGLVGRLLAHDGSFFFGDRPSTLDVVLASWILPILKAPLPEPYLRDLLQDSYPEIVSRALAVHSRAFPSPPSALRPLPRILPSASVSWHDALTALPNAISNVISREMKRRKAIQRDEEDPVDAKLRRGRWLWWAAGSVGLISYLLVNGIVVVTRGADVEEVSAADNDDEDFEE